ncbi:hypothetical protein COK39_19445 [Priestia megaterium]|nr:hypothetical protein COK39_19445 [Priestia megaterium]
MSVSKEKIRNKKAIQLTISKKGEPWTTRFTFLFIKIYYSKLYFIDIIARKVIFFQSGFYFVY